MAILSMSTQDNPKANTSQSWSSLTYYNKACFSRCLRFVLLAVMLSFALPFSVRGNAGILKESAIPAFPGAEGAGAFTPGGRDGRNFEVANLNDADPSSLRTALEAQGPCIVIFRVSGG